MFEHNGFEQNGQAMGGELGQTASAYLGVYGRTILITSPALRPGGPVQDRVRR